MNCDASILFIFDYFVSSIVISALILTPAPRATLFDHAPKGTGTMKETLRLIHGIRILHIATDDGRTIISIPAWPVLVILAGLVLLRRGRRGS